MIIGSDEYGGIARQDRITANADGPWCDKVSP